MAFVALAGGTGQPVTLALFSHPVTLPGDGSPVEVPDGYLPTLLDGSLTGVAVLDVTPVEVEPEAEPEPPKKRRKAEPVESPPVEPEAAPLDENKEAI